MKLNTINNFLGKFGLVLVIMYSTDDPDFEIRFWIEKLSTYRERLELIERNRDTLR